MILPKYWKMYSKIPFDYNNPQIDSVYMILFFEGRRAIFLRKDLTIISTFETRKARQLLVEAIEQKWRTLILRNSKLGGRPQDYPKEALEIHYIEIK